MKEKMVNFLRPVISLRKRQSCKILPSEEQRLLDTVGLCTEFLSRCFYWLDIFNEGHEIK